MPEDSIVYDLEDSYIWDSIARYYGIDEQLVARLTVFDNGIQRDEEFENGVRFRTVERDTAPEGGARSWDDTTTYYDNDGVLVARVTNYDNGDAREELFNNGTRERTTQTDADDGNGGNHSWSLIETYFDQQGDTVARVTTYDTGASREELFRDGNRERTTDRDADDGNGGAHNWQDVTSYFDEGGQIVARVTNYDDGGSREELFTQGIRERTIQTDASQDGTGSFSWNQLSSYYDVNGVMTARYTVFDNGTTREDFYQDGVKIETSEKDESNGGEAEIWSEIFTTYENGERAIRSTQYDNGVERTEEFFDGVRVRTTDSDASLDGEARSYEQSVTLFDENGALQRREILYDNGVQRTDDYDAGQRLRTVEYDVENAVSWSARSVDYDAAGQTLLREQLMDSGVQSTTDFENGLRVQRVDQDATDSFSWAFRGTTFDDFGVREKTYSGMDSGDEMLDLFDDGVRSTRVELDNDGSQDWAARVTQYDSSGAVSIRDTYDTLEELPPEYAGEFGLAVVGF